jgi:hypothetical protein
VCENLELIGAIALLIAQSGFPLIRMVVLVGSAREAVGAPTIKRTGDLESTSASCIPRWLFRPGINPIATLVLSDFA